jgi:hypothetical protein
MSYELILEKRPTYLHAKVVGERTPANARRFLEEAYAACVQSGCLPSCSNCSSPARA